MRYIISIIIAISLPFSIHAQGKGARYIPTQVKVGTDLSYLGLSLFSRDRNQYELNADIDFYRIYISGDFGNAEYKLSEEGFNYANSGYYYRAGVDYNLIKSDLDKYAIYMGGRYSSSAYTENFEYSVSDPVFGDFSDDIQDIDRNSSWFEIVLGMKVRIWNGFFLGWTGRFKFANSVSSEGSSFNNYWIPAYGKSTSDSMWGLNYQIFYQIPVRKRRSGELEEIRIDSAE